MARRHGWNKIGLWAGGALLVLVVVLTIVGFFMDEPLRAYSERWINGMLKGYSIQIGKLDVHPTRFSLDIEDLKLVQDAIPSPAVVTIDQWHASIEWRPLLSGRFVSSHDIVRPVLHVTRPQAKKEAEDKIPLKERGWQEVVRAIPFKINYIKVEDGAASYVDEANPGQPVRISQMSMKVSNIQNVRDPDDEYPSELEFQGVLLESGKLSVTGHADFLAEPIPGVKAAFRLEETPLQKLLPVTGRYNLQVRGGTLKKVEGQIEYAPEKKVIEVSRLELHGLRADYVHTEHTKVLEKERAEKAVETAKKVDAKQDVLIRVALAKLVDCELGYVDKATDPDYRVFVADTDIEVRNFSNQFKAGPADLKLEGKFMGTGALLVTGNFRPEQQSPDFDLHVQITQTPIKSLNDVLRAYGNLDVNKGALSFYSEVAVKNGEVRGYFKPLFKDVEVYNSEQDRNKGVLQKVYEGVAGGIVKLFENASRDEVATKAEVKGRLDNPDMDTFQALLRLVKNAFFDAILPGLESRTGKRR